jgi:SpoU rRNA methylase family enzyme
MAYRNGHFAVPALVAVAFALAAMVSTDAYSLAAQSEASAYSALTHEVGGVALLCLNDTVLDVAVQPVLAQ